jgi:Zn-dependent protease with chaperone function
MAGTIKRTVYFILLVFGLPLVGWVIGFSIASSAEGQILNVRMDQVEQAGGDDLATYECSNPGLSSHARAICTTYKAAGLYRDAAFWSICAGLGLIAMVWVTARACRNRPGALALLFGIEVRLVCLYLCGLTLIQGLTATFIVTLICAAVLKNPNGFLIGAPLIATLAGGYQMIRAAIRIVRRVHTENLAVVVTRNAQPRLWAFVDGLCEKLQASAPANIILGLEPIFFATAADVALSPSAIRLSGETMYLSLPLMRVLSLEELSAVIGHELGHFRGKDTVYSLRFLPIYLGMGFGIASIRAQQNPLRRASLYPALAYLSFCFEQFQAAERSRSRGREFAADAAGALASSGSAVVSALIKTSVFSVAWPTAIGRAIVSVEQGRPVANLSLSFEAEARRLQAASPPASQMADILASHQPHPTDTHPTLETRAAALGISSGDAGFKIALDGAMSNRLLENGEALENQLTAFVETLLARDLAKRRTEESRHQLDPLAPVPAG